MPSFDIVSELNQMEVDNAFNQAKKEISQRYDFKGTGTDVEKLADGSYVVKADNEGRIDAAKEMFFVKVAKRGVPLEHFESQPTEAAAGKGVRQVIKVKKGLEIEIAKKICAYIKELKLKVQGSIQGDTVRVTGKNKDDLQTVMHQVRTQSFGAPISFQNFRD